MFRRKYLSVCCGTLLVGGCNEDASTPPTGETGTDSPSTASSSRSFREELGEPPWGNTSEIDILINNNDDQPYTLLLDVDSRIAEPSPESFYNVTYRITPYTVVLIEDAFSADEPLYARFTVDPSKEDSQSVRDAGTGEEKAILLEIASDGEGKLTIR